MKRGGNWNNNPNNCSLGYRNNNSPGNLNNNIGFRCASILSERIAQHAIMNVCGEIFDSFQISDSYACRKGFGQYAALERACYFHRKNKWYLKLDVRKYFDSVSHDILKKLIAHKIKDFANHYLAFSDHYIKEQLGVKCFVRYMDDMILWDNDKKRQTTKHRSIAPLYDENFCKVTHCQSQEIVGYMEPVFNKLGIEY